MYKLVHHPSLTVEVWQKFPTEKQIFMVANEFSRLINGIDHLSDKDNVECMERALELLDLTINCQSGNLRKELLRLRESFSSFYPDVSKSGNLKEPFLKIEKQNIEDHYKVLLLCNSKSAIIL